MNNGLWQTSKGNNAPSKFKAKAGLWVLSSERFLSHAQPSTMKIDWQKGSTNVIFRTTQTLQKFGEKMKGQR